MIDIATRVHDHTWDLDPIVRSMLDTDFYKLLMAQTVQKRHADVDVTFSLINRTKSIPLADLVDEDELRAQLDQVRSLKLSRGEITWLRGNTFYGKQRMFTPEFIDWFEQFRFPEYQLSRNGDQYELTFEGPWPDVMMWEIPALAILTELRSRAVFLALSLSLGIGSPARRPSSSVGRRIVSSRCRAARACAQRATRSSDLRSSAA